MRFRPGNHQNIGARKEQQDAFGFSDLSDSSFIEHGGALAVLADGMGGLAEGKQASNLAVKIFLEAYSRKTFEETIENALERSFLEANDAVHAFADEKELSGNCGTTLLAAVVHESGVFWIYAGDSRLYITDGQNLTPLTEDHIYAHKLDRAVEKGVLERDEALANPDRDALTSYIGDRSVAIIGRGALRGSSEGLPPEGIILLLCSDGLYKTLSEKQILETYAHDPQSWCRALVERTLAEKRFYQDNITVVCLAAGTPEAQCPRERLSQEMYRSTFSWKNLFESISECVFPIRSSEGVFPHFLISPAANAFFPPNASSTGRVWTVKRRRRRHSDTRK